MSRKIKQKVIAILIMCMACVPQVYFADEVSSTQLEQAIRNVKQKIEIPSKLSEFSYHMYEHELDFSWSSKNAEESIDVACKSNGDILMYNVYTQDEGGKVASISLLQAKEKAQAFLKQVAPEYVDALVYDTMNATGRSNNYVFQYHLTHKDIPVYGQVVSVSVNKQTGIVESFEGINQDEKANYKGNEAKVNIDKAKSVYLSKIEIPVKYYSYYGDEEKENQKRFLAYDISDDKYGIDAVTGERIAIYSEAHEYNQLGIGYKEFGLTGAESSLDLTPAESEAVVDSKLYQSVEAIKKRYILYFPIIKNLSVLDSGISNDSESVRRFIFFGDKINQEAQIYCDGKTGELINYNYYSDTENLVKGKAWTAEEATQFLKEIAPQISKEVQLTSIETIDEDETMQEFIFTRYYEGIAVDGEAIYLTYNNALGQVTNYTKHWDAQIGFPSSKGILTAEQVLNKVGIKLYYMPIDEHTYTLAYRIPRTYDLVEAFKGKFIGYDGKVFEDTVNTYYIDIKGNKAEAIIKQLYDSGIYLEGTMLKPNETISQQELLRLLLQVQYNFESEDTIYKKAIESGLIDEQEKEPRKKLTREEGVKYLMRVTPYETIASYEDLYQYPYKDTDFDRDLKGAITLAYGLGITPQNEKEFYPKEFLTKADAMIMIYNLLQSEM